MVSQPIDLLYNEIKISKNLINKNGEKVELNDNQKEELSKINKESSDIKDKAVRCIVESQNYVDFYMANHLFL
jgi:hypothetical protein